MRRIANSGKKAGYVPIGYKLMLSYMVFIVILVSVNGYVSHSMYDASMRKQTEINIQGTLRQIKDNVSYKTDDLIRVSSMLYDDYNLMQSLRTYDEPGDNHNRMTNIIIPKLEVATRSLGFSQRLFVYFHNTSVSERYKLRTGGGSSDLLEQTYDIYYMSRIIDRDWYKTFPEEKYNETMLWKQLEEDAEEKRISLLRRIVDTNNPFKLQEIGLMRFNVRLSDLFESVDYSKLGYGSMVQVKDSEGNTLYTSGMTELQEDEEQSKKYITIEEKMGKQGWSIIAQVPITIIEQEAVRVRNFIIAVCVLCFVLFTFAGIFISRYFSIRITKFVSVLNAFREGNLHKRINYRGKDEFSQIATALNGMGEDVGALINKVYLTQLQKKEAELEMLQTQINPHFLYNTLSSINQLAKFGENEKLQKMVQELARFYRLTLSSGRTLIPIASEVEHSNAYVDIQKVKYGGRLEVMFDIDVNVWPYETIKLILQPFIENSLKHAWSGDRIHIRVTARNAGDDIVFRIIDDGMGMLPERLKEIMNHSAESETGYGIRNIDQRIKLQYGSNYGVTICSRLGIGTTVQIVIPAKRRKFFLNDEE